jgi:hypothetical protein
MQAVIPIRLTQDLGYELEVYVTGYAPRLGDKINHVWYDAGEKREIEMPPYCLTLLEYARANVYQYTNDAAKQYLQDVIHQSGPIAQAMLMKAVHFSNSSEVNLLIRSYIAKC